MEFRAIPERIPPEYVLARVEFRFRAYQGKDNLFEVPGALRVGYRLRDGGARGLDEEGLLLFAEVNGLYHVWPYLRELVASGCARLGAPTVTLPIWRLPPEPPPKGKYLVEEEGPESRD